MKLSNLWTWQKSLKGKGAWALPMLLGLVVTFLFISAHRIKPVTIEQFGNLVFDAYQRASPREYDPNIPVRIIDIDEESLKRIGQWPWPRTIIAQMNDRLTQAGAGVIAYDIIFSEPDRTSPENMVDVFKSNPSAKSNFDNVKSLKSHDEILGEAFARSNVVGAFFMTGETSDRTPQKASGVAFGGVPPDNRVKNYAGTIVPLEILQEGFAAEGSTSFSPVGDGIIRKAPLISRIGDRYYTVLSLEALRAYQGAGATVVKSSNASGEQLSRDEKYTEVAEIKVGAATVPTTVNGEIIVYFTTPQPARFIPAWKILSPDIEMEEWAGRIVDNVVFIGSSSLGLKDLVNTPIRGGEPGVMVHAQITEQIISGQYLKRPYTAGVFEFLAILLSGLLLSLLLPRLGAAKGVILSLLLGNVVFVSSWVAFKNYALLFNPVYPLLTILTGYVLMTLLSLYLTESERSRIKNAFSMYLSPLMVKKVSEDPSLLTLGGEDRELTILFLDVRSFSKISESMEPQDITTFLNLFLTPMTNLLQEHHATIDKYIGDAIVAFWNAPLDDEAHQSNAATCVLEMIKALDQLNETYQNQAAVKWPKTVKMGIGINTGVCTVGNLGSEQRFSYSMIGDAANLASRIEGLTKQYRVTAMAGSSTAASLSGFALLEADQIKVIGRETPERVFIIVGDSALKADSAFKAHQDLHSDFLKTYRGQDWNGAKSALKQLVVTAKPYEIEGYYEMMHERIAEFKLNPPAKNWDGVFQAKDK